MPILAHMQGVVYGKVPSKSNCYRVVRWGNKAGLAKGKDLKSYEKSFALQYQPKETIQGAFQLDIDVFYPSRLADLDNSLKIVLDCLQMVGAIKNDRYCQRIVAKRYIDKKNPRIEFTITEL